MAEKETPAEILADAIFRNQIKNCIVVGTDKDGNLRMWHTEDTGSTFILAASIGMMKAAKSMIGDDNEEL